MTNALKVKITQLPHGKDLPLPAYATPGSAGMDLYAALERPLTLYTGARHPVPCGISVAIPEGYEGQVRPRSGLARKHGVTVLNAPGTIDADYRGPVCVVLVNHGESPCTVNPGDRIAQLVVAPVARVAWEPVDTLDETERGEGGFGSTGA